MVNYINSNTFQVVCIDKKNKVSCSIPVKYIICRDELELDKDLYEELSHGFYKLKC